jgi:hypothetical protein
MKRRIERAFFNAKNILGEVLNMQRDAPTMHRSLFEALQDEKSKRSLEVVAL